MKDVSLQMEICVIFKQRTEQCRFFINFESVKELNHCRVKSFCFEVKCKIKYSEKFLKFSFN